MARRYHWHSATVARLHRRPAHAPSSASTRARFRTWWMAGARPAQDALLAIAREDPDRTLADVRRLEMPGASRRPRSATSTTRRLGAVLALAHERDLHDFAVVAPRSSSSVRARCSRWRSSPKWCTARRRASTIRRDSRSRTAARTAIPSRCRSSVTTSRSACCDVRSTQARLGHSEKLDGFRRLDAFTRAIEPGAARTPTSAPRSRTSARFRRRMGGRTVFDDRPRRTEKHAPRRGQLSLFDL